MRLAEAAAVVGVLALAGCATPPAPVRQAAACPSGQEPVRTAQLFFGGPAQKPALTSIAFRKFVDEEMTTRFPDGLTVLEGGGQWHGAGSAQIREADKVVLIVLPHTSDASQRVEAVRAAYRTRFHQDPVVRLDAPSCVAF